MASEHGSPPPEAASDAHEGWNVPHPEHLPRRTLWPVAAAFGTVLIFWAVVTSYVILAVGLALLAISTVGWINEIRREGVDDE